MLFQLSGQKLLLLPLFIGILSCGKKDRHENPAPSKNDNQFSLWQNDDEKLRWIDRLSRKLRNGQESKVDEQFLLGKPAEDIVEYMMNDPAFGMSLVDFNLHFLGFRSEKMKLPDGSPDGAFGSEAPPDFYSSYTTAIESASNALAGGDYLSILGMGTQPYIAPLVAGKIKFGDFEFDFDEQRQTALSEMDSILEKMTLLVEGEPRKSAFCALKSQFDEVIPYDGSLLYSTWRWAINPLMEPCAYTIPADSDGDGGDDMGDDTGVPEDPVLPEAIKGTVAEVKRRIAQVKEFQAPLHPSVYMPKQLSELKTADFSIFDIGPEQLKNRANQWFWTNFRNSSTNMNRKRGAYVLKRYFCDDLTPIGIELPEAHAGADRHATDPGCQSCHYKLDPMAGFFRYTGFAGNNFAQSENIIFDDFASKLLPEYIEQWKNPDHTGWNVGYVRSVVSPELNDMPGGDPGVNELFDLIKSAPEVKQCLVQNLFHYLVGEEVALDRGYLGELTQQFVEISAENSTTALRESIKKITTSRSFVEESPEKGVCYDYPSDYDATGKPPCEIAYILREACQQCHSSTNNQGGLDLETWHEETGFAHIDANGVAVSFAETLKRVDKRLTTADSEKRMPLAKFMSPHDRESLYKWVKSMEENL